MKKVLALVLVAVLAIGMSATTFAANVGKQIEVLGYSSSSTWSGLSVINYGGIVNYKNGNTVEFSGDVHPADKVKVEIGLFQDMFDKGVSTDRLTAADIRSTKIAVRSQVSGGSKVIKELSIDNKNGKIVLKFIEEWVSTKSQDFELLVYLTIDGRRYDDYGITFVGTVKNEEISVYGEHDYVDLALGLVAVAEEFNSKIEVDLGNGVSIFTKFFKGKKYYGTASRDADAADDIVFRTYPDVDNVVTLKTVGLNSTGDIVRLDTDYSNYYVYDKDLNYLGQSNEMLPYSSKYYLANKKLDILGDDEEEPDDDDGENPGTGGNGASSNANANPGTGR